MQQELRARKIGHTIFNNAVDRPWSQYFCCMVAGSADYVKKYPIATKRVLRAILEGRRPVRLGCAIGGAGRWSIAATHRRYDYTLQTLNVIAIRHLAGLRCRGHDAVLCAAHAGDGNDQVESAGDHR